MNSLPDIEEVKDQSINKGCGAVRVYRMLPEAPKKKGEHTSHYILMTHFSFCSLCQ